MRKRLFIAAMLLLAGGVAGGAIAMSAAELPAGPIRERHELMEGIGKNAKAIGDALKKGNTVPVAGAAQKIAADATKIAALFPAGSTHPKSRAKPEIWQDWPKFEASVKQLQTNAAALAAAAQGGGNVGTAAQGMFDTCKSCHDQFRVPEKKKA